MRERASEIVSVCVCVIDKTYRQIRSGRECVCAFVCECACVRETERQRDKETKTNIEIQIRSVKE